MIQLYLLCLCIHGPTYIIHFDHMYIFYPIWVWQQVYGIHLFKTSSTYVRCGLISYTSCKHFIFLCCSFLVSLSSFCYKRCFPLFWNIFATASKCLHQHSLIICELCMTSRHGGMQKSHSFYIGIFSLWTTSTLVFAYFKLDLQDILNGINHFSLAYFYTEI